MDQMNRCPHCGALTPPQESQICDACGGDLANCYGIGKFEKGDTVEIHPGFNMWMRGARVWKIVKVDGVEVYLRGPHGRMKVTLADIKHAKAVSR